MSSELKPCPNCKHDSNVVAVDLDGLKPLVCRGCGWCFRCDEPRPWLRAEEVREPGIYLMAYDASVNDVKTVRCWTAIQVMIDGETERVIFFEFGSEGEDWIASAKASTRFQRIPEPELPEGES